MGRRVYDARATDAILSTIRHNIQGAINSRLAQVQDTEDAHVQHLKQIDRVLLGVETAISGVQFEIEEANADESSRTD